MGLCDLEETHIANVLLHCNKNIAVQRSFFLLKRRRYLKLQKRAGVPVSASSRSLRPLFPRELLRDGASAADDAAFKHAHKKYRDGKPGVSFSLCSQMRFDRSLVEP
jgi:hypothetical protein